MKIAGTRIFKLIVISVPVLITISSCIYRPPVEGAEETVEDLMSCSGKSWITVSPYFSNDQIFEAKGLAAPEPNPAEQRDKAIQNAMNTLSTLYDSDIRTYSEQFTSSYRDWFGSPDAANSEVIYEQLRTILNENRLKYIKMDECRDRISGEWWVFVYISQPQLEAAEREVALEFQRYLTEERREEFRQLMEDQVESWQQKADSLEATLPVVQ